MCVCVCARVCVHVCVCACRREKKAGQIEQYFSLQNVRQILAKCVATKFDHHWPIRMPQSSHMIPLTNQNLLTHIPPEVHVSEVYTRGVTVHLLQEEDGIDDGVLQLQ